MNRGRLLVSCPDRPGIVSDISTFLFKCGATIVHSDQHSTDPFGGQFFLRVEFELPHLEDHIAALEKDFQPIADRHEMTRSFRIAAISKRLAIFAAREEHGLLELLWQRHAGDLRAEISMIISNHEEISTVADQWDVLFHHIPISPSIRDDAERQQLDLTLGHVDLIVLARYMQVLSPSFLGRWQNRIINIHRSFLPAFAGANPYALAAERGVKLIGATAHYVTTELDAGPIIEQDIHRVDHRHTTRDLRGIGRQVERAVLARAVIWHVEDRFLVHGNKTVVFS